MTNAHDPRNDGYNYGAGWPSNQPKPSYYHEGMKLSRVLNDEASRWANAAWALDHALRDVRLASRLEEQERACNRLAEVFLDVQRLSQTGRRAETADAPSIPPDVPGMASSNASGYSLDQLLAIQTDAGRNLTDALRKIVASVFARKPYVEPFVDPDEPWQGRS